MSNFILLTTNGSNGFLANFFSNFLYVQYIFLSIYTKCLIQAIDDESVLV